MDRLQLILNDEATLQLQKLSFPRNEHSLSSEYTS